MQKGQIEAEGKWQSKLGGGRHREEEQQVGRTANVATANRECGELKKEGVGDSAPQWGRLFCFTFRDTFRSSWALCFLQLLL